jgi:hypothetical protein
MGDAERWTEGHLRFANVGDRQEKDTSRDNQHVHRRPHTARGSCVTIRAAFCCSTRSRK